MRRSRFSEGRIIAVLVERERGMQKTLHPLDNPLSPGLSPMS